MRVLPKHPRYFAGQTGIVMAATTATTQTNPITAVEFRFSPRKITPIATPMGTRRYTGRCRGAGRPGSRLTGHCEDTRRHPQDFRETRMAHTLRYDAGAGAYDRLTGRWSRMYVDTVMNAARVTSGSHVLDVATGTGDAAIVAADLVGSSGTVVAMDISLPMLGEASIKADGRQIAFLPADARHLPFADGAFDALVCLFGLMFVPDQVTALKGFRRLLRPGGSVVATCWGTPARAPFAGLVAQALGAQMPEDHDDLLRPFSLSDPHADVALFEAAGFGEVRIALETRKSPSRRSTATSGSRSKPEAGVSGRPISHCQRLHARQCGARFSQGCRYGRQPSRSHWSTAHGSSSARCPPTSCRRAGNPVRLRLR